MLENVLLNQCQQSMMGVGKGKGAGHDPQRDTHTLVSLTLQGTHRAHLAFLPPSTPGSRVFLSLSSSTWH